MTSEQAWRVVLVLLQVVAVVVLVRVAVRWFLMRREVQRIDRAILALRIDEEDARDAREGLDAFKRSGERAIPFDEVLAEDGYTRDELAGKDGSMGTYWYAVNDEAREAVFIVGQSEEPTEAHARQKATSKTPPWLLYGSFRILADSCDEFDVIESSYVFRDAQEQTVEETPSQKGAPNKTPETPSDEGGHPPPSR